MFGGFKTRKEVRVPKRDRSPDQHECWQWKLGKLRTGVFVLDLQCGWLEAIGF